MNPLEIADAIESKRPRVLVVGDVMLDEYLYCEIRRGTWAGAPVTLVNRREYAPGGAANVAMNVAGLGGESVPVGVVGPDVESNRLRLLFGGSVQFVVAARPTTVKRHVLSNSGPVCRLDDEKTAPIGVETEKSVLAVVVEYLRGCSAVVLSDYAKGVCTPRVCKAVIGMAREAGIPVVADPKGPDAAKYRGVTVVKPNLKEARLLSSANGNAFLIDLFSGTSLVAVTADGEGMYLHLPDNGKWTVHIPAVPVPEGTQVDPTGAGDTVAAGLAVALAVGADVESAARFANLAAGLVVRKPGTATVNLAEIRASYP